MSLRVHLTDGRCLHATVHEQPSWFARIFLRRQEQDYPVWRVTYPSDRYVWLREDNNREVEPHVAAAIARTIAVRARNEAARRDFLRLVRGGR